VVSFQEIDMSPLARNTNPRLEFTTLKQKWQQQKGTTYNAFEGQQILPGFKGTYFK
jgi:hypothetical protein